MPEQGLLPDGVLLLERGWLSSNNVVVRGEREAGVVDTGYWTHSNQTLELITAAANGLPVTALVNTHLHSDHCGGNAALQASYPQMRTLIPPGHARAVREWDSAELTYEPTGQHCPRFGFDGVLQAGTTVRLGDLLWEVHSAPGHDPHSVIFLEPTSRVLISADALWQNGFGVVFPELEGYQAFDEVARTLDLIERLAPAVVIPGHGPIFTDVSQALGRARGRLEFYVRNPARHATHAAKVLLKFKLLELHHARVADLIAWAESTAYFRQVHFDWAANTPLQPWIQELLEDLSRSGAAKIRDNVVFNA